MFKHRPKVLLVDDLKIFQKIGQMYLENMGCLVKTANNGKEAVKEIVKYPEHYQLCIMDLQMPIMDGLEATVEIRKINKEILIVGLTAVDCRIDHEECYKAGMNKIIVKPVKQKRLIKLLKDYGLIDKNIRIRKIKERMPSLPLMDSYKAESSVNQVGSVIGLEGEISE